MRAISTFLMLLVFAVAAFSGCSSPSPQYGGAESSQYKGIDLRYRLYGPYYVSSFYSMDEPKWTVGVNITNTGSVSTNEACLKISLVNNKTNEVADSRFIYISCDNYCLAPGKYRDADATFDPGWQEEGYYRATAESCGPEWSPISRFA
jgi:hypothetical protein